MHLAIPLSQCKPHQLFVSPPIKNNVAEGTFMHCFYSDPFITTHGICIHVATGDKWSQLAALEQTLLSLAKVPAYLKAVYRIQECNHLPRLPAVVHITGIWTTNRFYGLTCKFTN
jgi:hypothetical protein